MTGPQQPPATVVRSIEITGGAARSTLVLPAPVGIVPVTVGGGASRLSVTVEAPRQARPA